MILNNFKQWWGLFYAGGGSKDSAEEAWDYQQKKLDLIEKHNVKTNGFFSIIPNYTRTPNNVGILNNTTGEVIKCYIHHKNGRDFIRIGNSPTQYLDEFTGYAVYIPFQVTTEIKL